MNIQELKLLGLPVLEAQLHCLKITRDKAVKIVRGKTMAAKVELSIYNDIEPFKETLYFPSEDSLPAEIKQAFEAYANRLCGEMWLLEAAIEQLRLEAFSNN